MLFFLAIFCGEENNQPWHRTQFLYTWLVSMVHQKSGWFTRQFFLFGKEMFGKLLHQPEPKTRERKNRSVKPGGCNSTCTVLYLTSSSFSIPFCSKMLVSLVVSYSSKFMLKKKLGTKTGKRHNLYVHWTVMKTTSSLSRKIHLCMCKRLKNTSKSLKLPSYIFKVLMKTII